VRLHTYLPLPGTPLAKYGIKPIPNTVKKELMKLLGRGVIFGDWLKQEELARKIVELMKEGIILS
jgi:DNA-binding PadR family transcriptional regulator